jgi:hypothetical protein
MMIHGLFSKPVCRAALTSCGVMAAGDFLCQSIRLRAAGGRDSRRARRAAHAHTGPATDLGGAAEPSRRTRPASPQCGPTADGAVCGDWAHAARSIFLPRVPLARQLVYHRRRHAGAGAALAGGGEEAARGGARRRLGQRAGQRERAGEAQGTAVPKCTSAGHQEDCHRPGDALPSVRGILLRIHGPARGAAAQVRARGAARGALAAAPALEHARDALPTGPGRCVRCC